MKTVREIEIQDLVTKKLVDNDISPFSVTCTFESGHEGLIGITFWLNSDLYEFLDILDYKNQCDKSGYIILSDNNTVLLFDMALFNLYTKL